MVTPWKSTSVAPAYLGGITLGGGRGWGWEGYKFQVQASSPDLARNHRTLYPLHPLLLFVYLLRLIPGHGIEPGGQPGSSVIFIQIGHRQNQPGPVPWLALG